ncbi:MAG TPA: MFS transporter [Candidatus Binataceae bacterium]|nr:MFS transporter [Candidatus Binataceae bacterium]
MSPAPESAGAGVLRRVTRRYYAVSLIYAFAGGFLFGVYPLFLRARGLDQLEINSVMAVYFVVIFLTDIPTGAFADAIGRRNSFVIGCALRVIAFVVYFFAHRYALFILAEIIDGVGTTFCNGAIDAWGVDAVDAAGYTGLKDRLFSRIQQLTAVGWMGSALIGAYIANVDIAWPWLVGAAGYVVSAAVAMMLMEEQGAPRSTLKLAEVTLLVARRVAAGMRQGFGRRTVLFLSLANAMSFAAWSSYWMQWPQLVNDDYHVGIWIVGWIFCLLTIGQLIGAEVVARVRPDESRRGVRLATLVVGSAAMLAGAGLSARRPNVVVALLFGMRICTGAMQPLVSSWLNEQIDAEQRATLLSFANTFATLGGSGGLVIGGFAADRLGIPTTWLILAAIALLAAPCFWTLRPEAGAMPIPSATAK